MDDGETRTGLSDRVIVGIGLVVIAVYIASLVHLWRTSTYDIWGAMIVGPVLFVLSLPVLVRQARREGDPQVLWILVAALGLKLIFAVVRYHFAFEVYEKADARRYNGQGARLAAHFLAGNFNIPPGDRGGGTRFIEIVMGIIYTITRPTVLGGHMAFAWLGFWGQFYFYRAFHLAVPEGRTRSYAVLLFFLPSLLYWPAGPGKESWMLFTLGIAAYGGARVLTGRAWKGMAILAAALWLAIQVRPHYPGFLAISLGLAYLVGRQVTRWRHVAPLVKVAGVGALLFVSAFLLQRTQEFLGTEALTDVEEIESTLTQTAAHTQQGGSRFRPVNLISPLGPPLAAFTVLFRPVLIEAHNAQAAAAALEGSFLLGLTALRWRWVLAAIRRFRRRAYLVLVSAYTGAGIIALSAIGNFGILTRQRVLIYPAFLALLCVPHLNRSPPQGEGRREEELALAGRGA